MKRSSELLHNLSEVEHEKSSVIIMLGLENGRVEALTRITAQSPFGTGGHLAKRYGVPARLSTHRRRLF